ncbi:MAG: DUF2459 domain-containing protein [Verrucomicrobiaceae bacterium]|nr:MAG: DUF2459 domain-containing protein [Verrucomicrobiaceae bacterium]
MFSRSTGCLAAAVLAVAALPSCGIRLPDAPALTYKEHVSTAPVERKLPVEPEEPGKDPDVLVWLIADKIHTGVVFPYDWLLESGFVPPEGFGNPRFVTLSWGNRTAYVERGLKNPVQVFEALFTPSPSVMELIPANWDVVEVCPHQRIWRKLVSRERGRDLAAFLNDCSKKDAAGRPIVCGTSSWGGGVLLESRHRYFIPRVCNIWTAQVIETLGCKIDPWGTTTANGLVKQVERPPNNFEQIWWGGGLAPGEERYR